MNNRPLVPLAKRPKWDPVLNHQGLPTWVVVTTYKCVSCRSSMLANDGRMLLYSLPCHIQSAYPVQPKYANGLFHFNDDLTFDLELCLMRTYANARFVSNKLYRKIGRQYTNMVKTYLSRNTKSKFPSMKAWSGGVVPPSGDTIRQLFKSGEKNLYSTHMDGYSDIERGTREIQLVKVKTGDMVAYDWTFAALSNYFNNKAKAILFTGNKGSTHEVVFLALVPSTSVSDVAHLLEQAVKRRKHFEPSMLYTDTCPHNTAFFLLLHGNKLAHILGLFRLQQRMIETYNKRSED
jgi:hypothetical protein